MRKFYLVLLITFITTTKLTMAKRYIGGDEWNRQKITKETFHVQEATTKELILRTVKVVNERQKKVGTAFLYKQDETTYTFLTNFHVISTHRECRDSKILIINEEFKKFRAKCEKILDSGSIKSGSDYTYFKVKKTKRISFLENLSDISLNFPTPKAGDQLVSVGFGAGKADLRRYDASIIQDKDCVYLAGNIDLIFNKDKVRDVFFTACDAQSGDSGSAIMNSDTGDIIGLFFGVADQDKNNPLSTSEIWDNIGTDYLDFYTNSSMSIDLKTIQMK
ncbi:serine protease [Halobacteriovorax sp. HFRX-2_2]|uniref:S1 family peptidase n=1 Tax=unclassified Halobacteriovorax TaxID=2639665 RepID=UPI00371C39DA